MSKHKDYRNYRAMSGKPVDEAIPEDVKEEVTEVISEAAANEEVDVDEGAAADLPTIEEDKNDPLVGVVAGCSKLRIRKKPSTEGDVMCVVDAGTVLMIDIQAVVPKEWFKVYTEAGVEGFCMREFVEIRE